MPTRAPSGAAPTGLLLTAFGTNRAPALKAYTDVEAAFRAAWPDQPLVWAYTSTFVRKRAAACGAPVHGIAGGMDALAAQGVRHLVVQSLHVVAGEEFAQMERSILAHALRQPGRFDSVRIGRPLLESLRDMDDAVSAVLAELPAARTAEDAVVLMAHGHEHGRADLVLEAVAAHCTRRDPRVWMATIEGGRTLDDLLAPLRAAGVRRVWLQPFLIVAGEHAMHDLLGPGPESWASRLTAEGFAVEGVARGLGELAGIRALFVRHAREADDDILQLKDAGDDAPR